METKGRSALWEVRTRLAIHPPPPPPQPKLLNATIPYQEQSNWCWVAAGSGISSYYDGVVHPQCYVVTLVFTTIHPSFHTDCCSPAVDPSQQPCNGQSGADQALDHPNHHFAGNQNRPLDWTAITEQIDSGRPFAAGIAWSGQGNHFAVITGYTYSGGDPSIPCVYVQDPFYGPSWWTQFSFTNNYQQAGTWQWTTLSQP